MIDKQNNQEPSDEQVAAAVLAFQESTNHKILNISTAQLVFAVSAALRAALKMRQQDDTTKQ